MTRLRLPAWVTLLAASLAGLRALGSGPLAAPASLAAWPGWLGRPDPVLTIFALLRLLALGLGWYLLVITATGAAARWSRAPRLAAALDAVTLPGVRRLLDASCGLAVVAASCLPAAALWPASAASAATPIPSTVVAGPTSTPPVLHWLGTLGPVGVPPSSASTAPTSRPTTPVAPPASVPAAAAGAPVRPSPTTTVGPAPASPQASAAAPQASAAAPTPGTPTAPDTTPDTTPATTPAATPATPAAAPQPDGTVPPATWTVRRGDHLWAIAHATLATAWGRPVTDGEIARYWTALVAVNGDRLAVPGVPDLIYVGQVFVLPPVSPAP